MTPEQVDQMDEYYLAHKAEIDEEAETRELLAYYEKNKEYLDKQIARRMKEDK